MKTIFFIPALFTLLFSYGTTASQNVNVSLQGEFVSGTCDVGVNGGGADGTVTLPAVTADELNEKGTAGTTTFHFTFSNCEWPSNKMIQVYFEGGSTVDTSNYYLINSGGTATGVELILKTPGGNQIHPGTDIQAGGDSHPSGTYTTGNFSVAYITGGSIGTAQGGTVKSYVTYHLNYK